MAVQRRQTGIVGGIRIDLRRLHESWMELVFPRQRTTHAVLGKWTPSTTGGWVAYRLWGALGVLAVGLLYPLALFGFAVRFYSRRIDTLIAGIGIAGVVVIAAVVWGALTVVARLQFSTEGFLAVAAAAAVATVCAGLAALFTKVGGRGTTVVLAYPSAMTAIFLPPVVAALFSTVVGDVILPPSEQLAIWLLDTVLVVGGLNEWLRAEFELAGMGYVVMWVGISVPAGWFLGGVVTLADLVRPTGETGEEAAA